MKKFLWIILFLSNSSALYCTDDDSLKYIIITRLGITNYSFPSLILSVDSITNIEYQDNNFEDMIKYKHYENILISKNLMYKLYNCLKLTNDHNERLSGFSKKELLLIDYRLKNIDYELITGNSLIFTLFILKKIYCVIKQEEKKYDYLLLKISNLYSLYIKSYNSEDYYYNEINCCN